jgi:hypothetical protein
MLLALSGTLIGAILGIRFTVLALIPAIGCASVIAGASWLAGGLAFGSLVMEWALLVTCLQLGYLSGAALRFLLLSMGKAHGGAGTKEWRPHSRFLARR